jgi:hypothetical protein
MPLEMTSDSTTPPFSDAEIAEYAEDGTKLLIENG